jgi:hypothetical protein
MDVDDAEVMSRLTQMVMERMTQEIAKKAREFAANLPFPVTGPEALRAFADSIESTNAKTWPKGNPN